MAESVEHGRCDIAQGAAGAQMQFFVVADEDEGDWIGGVIGVRAAVGGIDHGFGVAVVGGDDPGAAAGFERLINLGEAGVDGFNGFDSGFEFSGMADHVGVGVVHDDGVELAFFDGFHDRIGDALRGHFGLEVVGGYFWRGDENAFFAAEGFFDAAVEEIGYVGVFFGFGATEVFVLHVRENLGEDLFKFFGGEHVLEPGPVFVVLGHGDVEKIFGAIGAGEFVEVRSGQRVGHLAGAVGAEVEEDDGVVIVNQADGGRGCAGAFRYHDGLDEFVGDVLLVAALQRGEGIGGARFGFAVDEGAIGEFDALPAIVAVHGVIAADE